MKLLIVIVLLNILGAVLSVRLMSGRPVPGAYDLYRMVLKYVYQRHEDVNGDTLINYILGASPTSAPGNDSEEIRDMGVLDLDKIKKLVLMAKDKQQDIELLMAENIPLNVSRKLEARRNMQLQDDLAMSRPGEVDLRARAMSFMQQSIYQTRYNLKRTKPIRKRYMNSPRFSIGVNYGALMQMRLKIRSLLEMMQRRNNKKTKFIYYLINYEKILATHTDIAYMVQRCFEFHSKAEDMYKSQDKNPTRINRKRPTTKKANVTKDS